MTIPDHTAAAPGAAETIDTAASLTPVLGGGDVLSTIISMLFIVAVIVVLGWLYSRSRLAGGANGDTIKIIAARPLGPKERLLVVEVADQQLLLGMTAGAVQTLHVFDNPVPVDKSSAAPAGFAHRLRAAVRETGR